MPVPAPRIRSAVALALAAAALAAVHVRPAAAAEPTPAAAAPVAAQPAPAPASTSKPSADKASEMDLGQKRPSPAAVLEEVTGTVAAVDRQARRIDVTTAKGPVTLGLDRNTLVYTVGGLGTVLDIAPGQPIRAGRNAVSTAYWVQIRPLAPAKPPAAPAPAATEATPASPAPGPAAPPAPGPAK